jgi:hypothetical protein
MHQLVRLSALTFIICGILTGCAPGIYSLKPILNDHDADTFDRVIGYWKCTEPDSADSSPLLVQIGHNTVAVSGKEHTYTIIPVEQNTDQSNQDIPLMRIKNNDNMHALQICAATEKKGASKKSDKTCTYFYLTEENNGSFNLYQTIDANLSVDTRNILGKLYKNAKDKNEIELPDSFVSSKGKALLDSLANNKPHSDTPDSFISCQPVSPHEAKTLAAQQNEQETPK